MRKEITAIVQLVRCFFLTLKSVYSNFILQRSGKRKFLALNKHSLTMIGALKPFQFLETTQIPLVSHSRLKHVYNTTLAPRIKRYNKQLQNFRLHFCHYWYKSSRREKVFKNCFRHTLPGQK